jgi:hypothetical protein
MRKAILDYIWQSVLIGIMLSVAYYLFCAYGYPQLYTKSIFLLVVTLLVINIGFHSYFVYTAIKKNEAFVRVFLASTMLKLMIYLGFLLFMIFTGQAQIKVVLVSFLFFYFVFTTHEISTILRFLKKNSSAGVKSK